MSFETLLIRKKDKSIINLSKQSRPMQSIIFEWVFEKRDIMICLVKFSCISFKNLFFEHILSPKFMKVTSEMYEEFSITFTFTWLASFSIFKITHFVFILQNNDTMYLKLANFQNLYLASKSVEMSWRY